MFDNLEPGWWWAIGGLLLLNTPSSIFSRLVPWLVSYAVGALLIGFVAVMGTGAALRPAWRAPLGLLAFLGAAAGIRVPATHGAQTTADEPQYLLTAISLAEDRDLDIADELAIGSLTLEPPGRPG